MWTSVDTKIVTGKLDYIHANIGAHFGADGTKRRSVLGSLAFLGFGGERCAAYFLMLAVTALPL